MKVFNNTGFAVIAFGWHSKIGYGDDVTIDAGSVAEVNGPYIGETGDTSCYDRLAGMVICQETPDNESVFQIALGLPIHIALGNRGATIRHHSEQPEECVIKWRNSIIKRN